MAHRKSAATGGVAVANLPPRVANLPPELSRGHRKCAATLIDPIYKPIGVGRALWITRGRSRLWRGRAGGLLPPGPWGCAPGHAFARPAPLLVFIKKASGWPTTRALPVNPLPSHFLRLGRGLTEWRSMRAWFS